MMRARQNSAGSDCNNPNGVNGAGHRSISSDDVGEIHFSMKYDFQQNTFVVRVIVSASRTASVQCMQTPDCGQCGA